MQQLSAMLLLYWTSLSLNVSNFSVAIHWDVSNIVWFALLYIFPSHFPSPSKYTWSPVNCVLFIWQLFHCRTTGIAAQRFAFDHNIAVAQFRSALNLRALGLSVRIFFQTIFIIITTPPIHCILNCIAWFMCLHWIEPFLVGIQELTVHPFVGNFDFNSFRVFYVIICGSWLVMMCTLRIRLTI